MGAEALGCGLLPDSVWTSDADWTYSGPAPTYCVTPALFKQISTLKTAQPPLYVFERPALPPWTPSPVTNAMLMDHIQDPGNAGALVRAASAFKLDQVLWLGGVDPYHPSCIRSSAGQVFRVQQYKLTGQQLSDLPNLICASADAKTHLPDFQWPSSFTLAMGNEGHGFSSDVLQHTALNIRVPTQPHVESLNVTGAAHILLYHWSCQRDMS